MSLSNLSEIAAGQMPGYTRYTPTPTGTYTGPSETELQISILGYLNTNNQVMLFSINDNINTGSSLQINASATSDTINVTDSTGNNSQSVTNYYTVDFGKNTSSNAWSINFNITLKGGSTASWIFTKGKTEEPNHK